ncbi:MAG: EpsG family protein [Clostridia bacterium]|nr:EpsG family protein [Clostridia bacterium]
MLLYIFVAIVPLFVGALYDGKVERFATADMIGTKKYIRTRRWWLMIAALPMFALIAFRGPWMGADTGVYIKFFNQMVDTPWDRIFAVNHAGPEFEVGFVIFEKLMTHLTHNAQVYQVLYTSVYFIAVLNFACQLEKEGFLFLFFFATLGTYTFMFTGVRQCLAMSICLLSYNFVRKRQFVPFALMVILAYSFHNISIIFFAVYFIYPRKINAVNGLIYLIIGLIVFLSRDTWQKWFYENFDYYAQTDADGTGTIFFVVVLAITVFSVFFLVNHHKITEASQGVVNVGFITLLFWTLRLFTKAAGRPSYFFMFFTMATLVYGIDALEEGKEKTTAKALICLLCLALFVYRLNNSAAALVPYQSFF